MAALEILRTGSPEARVRVGSTASHSRRLVHASEGRRASVRGATTGDQRSSVSCRFQRRFAPIRRFTAKGALRA